MSDPSALGGVLALPLQLAPVRDEGRHHEANLTVLVPEPQRPEGGFMPDGPERDAAMRRLHHAYGESGFKPWPGSTARWRVLP